MARRRVEVTHLRPLALVVAVAVGLAVAYAAYLQPEWEPGRSDQVQYLALARGLAERAEYTRATAGEPFIPEPLRSPGYPAFLAVLCRTTGCGQWQIALAQTALLAGTVLMTHAFARRVLPRRGALAAAALVGLYPAFSYHAALALSETLATTLLMGVALAFLRLRETGAWRWALVLGLALGGLALTRILFFVVPLLLLWVVLVRDGRGVLRRSALLPLTFAIAVAAVTFVPYVAYSQAHFGRPLTGAGGAVLWLGAIQGLRESELDPRERAILAAARADDAAFDAITDRSAQALAWPRYDAALRRHALELIAHDPLEWVARGLTVRSIELWAGDVPARVAEIGGIPRGALITLASLQLALFLFGLIGVAALFRRGQDAGAVTLAIVIGIWLVSFPFGAEGRYVLPVRPFVAIAAVAGISALARAGRWRLVRRDPADAAQLVHAHERREP